MKRSDAEWRDEGLELEQEVVRHISGADFQGAHPGFDALALRLFRYQFRFNDPYRRFCENLGVRVDDVDSWSSAPALPTDAFKVAPLRTFPPEETRATFKTSGTSGGARGHHLFTSLEIYNIALLSCFERFMLPDGARLSILSLIPPAGDVPDSSLSYMIELLMRTVGSDESEYFLTGTRFDTTGLLERLRRAEERSVSVMLVSTAFALATFLKECSSSKIRLPAGSRLMQTGGMKGRRPEMTTATLYRLVSERLGIPESHCVAEYGMTELSSQMYEISLLDGQSVPSSARVLCGPPWLRVQVIDPGTLKPCAPGQTGLIRFFDLANVHSVSAIQTSDEGRLDANGLVLLGRDPSAAPRGCSLTAEELLSRRREGGG